MILSSSIYLSEPSKPVDFQITHVNMSEVDLKWKLPQQPNGLVESYKIFVRKDEKTKSNYGGREFCSDSECLLLKPAYVFVICV